MMLFKLSFNNIKKSFKDYAIYFFTLILGVAIFYVFNAIESQTVLLNVTKDTRDIIQLMTNILSGVSVFVSFILGFLIIYASRFLIKRRKKEFGIYLTLGMSKQKISRLLFFETFLIGLISLIVGLGFGIILSQLMSLFVANMFEADLTEFAFTFSFSASFKTLVYFGIMYVLVMIFNTINVSRCKLIDLLYASKKSERVKLKNSVLCTIIFGLSIFLLGYAYYLVTGGFDTIFGPKDIFKPIILGVLGTFLLFWSASGLLLGLVTRIRKHYYKGLNSFVFRQVSSKINTTVFSSSIICLMLFVTICVLSSALSIKNSMTANLKSLAPVDVQFSKVLSLTEEDVNRLSFKYNFNMIEDSKIPLRETLEKLDFDVENLTDVTEFNIYENGLTIRDTLGSYYDEASKKYSFMEFDSTESFVRLSDYNRLMELYGRRTYTLRDDEYILVADYKELVEIRNEALKRNTPILLLGKKYYPKFESCEDGFIYMNSTHANTGVFVVPDQTVEGLVVSENVMTANYVGKTDSEKEKIESLIRVDMENHEYAKYTGLEGSTKRYLYEASVGLGAMVTFIGLYLGIIFLMSSAAILALKELSESSDNKERFRMLRKIGASDAMVNQALFRQIGIFFLFPLMIAIVHSVFGILFSNHILSVFGNEKLLPSIVMTAFFMIMIYGGYFMITYWCSKSIVKERR